MRQAHIVVEATPRGIVRYASELVLRFERSPNGN
jgi:hypothetical protein